MKKFIIATFLCCSFLNAQFTIKGRIDNYPNKRILVKLNNGMNNFIAGNITTDTKGEFSQKIIQKYIGSFYITLLDANAFTAVFVSDNKDINLGINASNSAIINYGNKDTELYYNYLTYVSKKENIGGILQNLLPMYNTEDKFYKPLEEEFNAIRDLKEPDYQSREFLNYLIPSFNIERKASNGKATKGEIVQHFANSGEYYYTSGIEKGLLLSYIKISGAGETRQEFDNNLRNAIDKLLDEVGEDTKRGQDILGGIIGLLISYDINNIADEYIKRGSSLKCESPELKKILDINSEITEGKKIPNLKFTPKLNKYSDLYSIKASQKLLIVWASWCGHCQQEKPHIAQFYENFKKKGGEIVTLAVDTDKNDWTNFIKDTPGLNYSDLLGWDSPMVQQLNVSGTPTLFLLDKDNKILKIAASISEINEIVNK